MKALPILAAALVVATGSAAAADAQSYQRCSSCHLDSGAGVPGSFPSLRKDPALHAKTLAGRRYLVLAITRGLAGPITSEGKVYRGVMPAQAGMSDDEIARALNHVLNNIARAPPSTKRFTAAEVSKLRKGGAGLSAAAIANSRPKTR